MTDSKTEVEVIEATDVIETDAITLKHIMDIPENELSVSDKEMWELSFEQRLFKWKENVNKSVASRLEYIHCVQENNKKVRLQMLQRSTGDDWKKIIETCKADPIFFFNMFLWTYNPRLDKPHVPFITYPYQDQFIKDIIESVEIGIDVRVEKSRDMWLSWTMLWIFLWWFLFKEWSVLLGSYKEDYVDAQWNMDSAFERLRYMLKRLPKQLRPKDVLIKYMNISAEWCWEISWDVWVNFWTWWRRKVVFMDEFALRPRDETALQKTKDVTECRIFWWTPNGTWNVYGKVMTNHKSYRHLLNKKIRLPRKLHPLKTNVWYEFQKMTRTATDLAQEVDISYETSVVNAVYPLFLQMATKGTYVYDMNRHTYGSWDFGRDSIAFCLWQKDFQTGNVYLIKSFRRVNWNIKDFAWLVLGKPYAGNSRVYDERDFKIMKFMQLVRFHDHFGDPYNSDNRTVLSDDSIRKALREMWIHITTNRKSTLRERITKTQLGMNRLFYDKDNYEREQSIIQSHYPQKWENRELVTEQRSPVHDENSHFRTCTEYFFDNEPLTTWDDDGLVVNSGLYS